MSSQGGSKKLLQGLVSHKLTAYLTFANLLLTQWIMAILSKGYKSNNFEPHNSSKLRFTNIQGLHLSFIKCGPCPMWGKSGWPNWFYKFFCEGLSSFNPKRFYYSNAWSSSLRERKTSFCLGLISSKLCGFLLMFPTNVTSLSVALLLPLLTTFFMVMHGFWFYFI